jgi:surface polysaccharide O-acyltransferase-like enzyme
MIYEGERHNMEIKNERYNSLDLLKFIAIYFVIVYHFNKLPTNFLINDGFVLFRNYYIRAFLSICVPLFFFVNGALLLNRNFNLKKHTIKIIKIVFLTEFWGLITLIILMFIRGEYLSFPEIVTGTLHLKLGWNNHLWFLQALTVIYIFFPMIKNAYDNNKNIFNFFLIVTLILTFGNVLLFICANLCEFLFGINHFQNNYNFFFDFNALKGNWDYSLGYFMLGGIFLTLKDRINIKNQNKVAIISIAISTLFLMLYGIIVSKNNEEIYDITWYGYNTVFTLINIIAIYTLTLSYKGIGTIGSFIKTVGENSLGIYLLHMFFGYALLPVYEKLIFSTGLFMNLIFSLIILLISLFISLMLKRIPIIKQLFSF